MLDVGLRHRRRLGMAVLIRPTNVVLILPLLLSLGWSWRVLLATALGGLPCAAWLFYYNAHTYGSVFTTGYGDMSTAFDQRFLIANLAHFSFWVPLLISLPLAHRRRLLPVDQTRRAHAAHSRNPHRVVRRLRHFLRHLFLRERDVVVSPFSPSRVSRRDSRRPPRWPGLAHVATVAAHRALPRRTSDPRSQPPRDRHARRRTPLRPRDALAHTHVPPGSVIIGSQLSGALHYYSQFIFVRTELLTPAGLATLRSAAGSGAEHPIYTALFRFEDSANVHRRLGGTWEPVTQIADVEISRLVPTTP